MLKQLLEEYNRTGIDRQLIMPLDTEVLIPNDTSVRLLDQALEELDYSNLYLTYSAIGRNPAVDPRSLFKVIIYAYSQNIYTSRKIEDACRYDIRFRYLLRSTNIPDHNTINRFRKYHLCGDILKDLFLQFTNKLAESNEIKLSEIFIDGTKIEANANKYTFVWKRAIDTNYGKMKLNVAKYISERFGRNISAQAIDASLLKRVFQKVRNRVKHEKIQFVHGKGCRKTSLQREYETVEDWKNRAMRYEEALSIIGDSRNSCSKTDHVATFMHMKDDYMRNGQLKPGYNVQVATNSEYVLDIYVSSDRNDQKTLIPFLDRIRNDYHDTIGAVVADAGYESEENYHYLDEHGIRSFIKPSNHEYSKTRKYQKAMEIRNSMKYDPLSNSFICRNGRKLKYRYDKRKTGSTGYVSISHVYECDDCSGCPFLGKCYKGKYGKRIQVADRFDKYREESEKNIDSKEGIILRLNRSIQAEGVFGITKQDMEFTRFFTRGKDMVETEYLLLSFGFNINKMYHRLKSGRFGQSLFCLEA